MEKNKVEATSYISTWVGELKFEINCMHGVRYVVDLGNQTWKCRRWDLTSIPCPHVVSIIFYRNMETKVFVHSCYHVAAYKRAYGLFLKPMNGADMWLK